MMLELIEEFESQLGLFSTKNAPLVKKTANIVQNEINHSRLFMKAKAPVDHLPKKTIGIVFSGGPAPGGHDVLCGILSFLRSGDALIGFCGGPGGLLNGIYKLIPREDIEYPLLNSLVVRKIVEEFYL